MQVGCGTRTLVQRIEGPMKHGAGVPRVWAQPSCRRVFLCVLDFPVCSVRVTQPPVVLLCTWLLTSAARPGRGFLSTQ